MKKGGHTSASYAENHPNEGGSAHLFAQFGALAGQGSVRRSLPGGRADGFGIRLLLLIYGAL